MGREGLPALRSLTWEQVHRRRLVRGFLATPAPRLKLAEVAGAVCGVQAQILTAGELSLGLRVAGVTQQDIRRELWERRSLVKTYGPRGTLHLLPANELPLWMAALRTRQTLLGVPWYEAPGPPPDAPGLPMAMSTAGPLTAAQGEEMLEAIADALDGRTLTRDELAAEVKRRLGEWAGSRLRSSWATPPIGQAALTGRLCFGPNKGAQITFVRADQWIGGWKDVDPDQALMEVIRRYLNAYGPATHADFAAWFNLKPSHVRPLMQRLAGELEEVEVDGWRAWLPARGAGMPRRTGPPSVRLLPQYDCYILGVRQRERILPEAARRRLMNHPKGRLEGLVGVSWVLIDGVIAGSWERRSRGKRIDIRVERFRPLNAEERRLLRHEVKRIGEFFGGEVEFTEVRG